jgi:hypothetical protein
VFVGRRRILSAAAAAAAATCFAGAWAGQRTMRGKRAGGYDAGRWMREREKQENKSLRPGRWAGLVKTFSIQSQHHVKAAGIQVHTR